MDDDELASTVASVGDVAFAATAGSGDPPPASGPLPAQIGRYRIVRILGEGGMGVVYLAMDPKLDRKVAIKVLRQAGHERLLREGQAIAKLRHPNVVGVYDVGEHGDALFIAMEHVPGGTLGEWLREPRAWRDVLARFTAAGRGLAAAHAADLVHRDFKPDNVLLDGDRVVVTDFGLARAEARASMPSGDLSLTQTGSLLGTPSYMSPEQLGGKPIDARSDQFSFAVAVWEALFGTRPYDPPGAPPRTIDELRRNVLERSIAAPTRKLPATIVRALRRALDRAPDARHPSMDALLDALRPPRRRAPWIAGGVALVGVAAAGVVVTRDRASTGPDCDAAAATIDGAWNRDARAAYLAVPGDPALAAEDAAWFDDVATTWKTTRTAVCRDRRLDTEHRAQAESCLEEARAALVAAQARDDRTTWPQLRDPAACASATPRGAEAWRFLHGGQGNTEYGAAFAPDGTRLAFANSEGATALVDVATGLSLPSSLPRLTWIRDWSTDGRWIIGSDGDASVRVDATTGEVVPLPGKIAVAPDLRTSVRFDGGALVFSTIEPAPPRDVARLELPARREWHLGWEPDGHRVSLVAQSRGERASLALVDLSTGAVTNTPLRVIEAFTYGRTVWRSPGVLVIAGAPHNPGTCGVWELHVDDQGRLASFPRLLTELEDNIYAQVVAANGRKIIVDTYDASSKLFDAAARTTIPLPGAQSLLLGADAAHGRLLISSQETLFVVDRVGKVLASQPRSDDLVYGLRDGELLAGHRTNDRDPVALGSVSLPAALASRMTCSAWRPERCVVFRRNDDHTATIAAVHDDVPAASRTVPLEIIRAVPTADGARALVTIRTTDGATGVAVLDLETGEHRAGVVDAGTIWTSHYTWGPDDRSIYYVVAVDGEDAHFQIRRKQSIDDPSYTVEVDSGSVWISGLAVLDDKTLLYTASEFESKLSLLELP